MSLDPFHKVIKIPVSVRGNHPTLGLIANPTPIYQHHLQLTDMAKSTPGNAILKWRSTVKKAIILQVDGQLVTGSLMLYYDPMNLVADHLKAAYPDKYPGDGTDMQIVHDTDNNVGQDTIIHNVQGPPLPDTVVMDSSTVDAEDRGKSFTLCKLKKCLDWQEWHEARYAMLDSYQEQGMFSEPMEAPPHANVHHMLWRYQFKMCGKQKARMVCDGSTRQCTIV